MKNRKIPILLTTAVLLLLAVGIGYMEPAPQPEAKVNMPFSAVVMLDGKQERIRCWQDTEGNYCIFLPSGAELCDVTLFPERDARVVLNGKQLEQETACAGFQTEQRYPLIWSVAETTTEHSLTFLQSVQMPSLYLDVQSGSMDLIHETKGNQESGSLRLYSSGGELTYSGRVESVKGRGNFSWTSDKKPYSLTLSGEANLLNMGYAKNWILLANAFDASHVRNKVVYDLAAETDMAYSPECTWVDLYLNGEYAGLYLLSERNEIHPERVNLKETGSFLVSRESKWRLVRQNYPHLLMDSGAALRIHSSGFTKKDLYEIWQSAENAILSENGKDALSGKTWQELIDMDSWAMDYLMGEVFGNIDAGIVSVYFYRDGSDPSGKIYAGPVWDYDMTMGNKKAWQAESVQAFFADRLHIWSFEDTTWSYGLNRKPEFQKRVRELYRDVFRPKLQELLETGLDRYADQVCQSAMLDQYRWGTENAREETEYIREYLTERLAFLDSVWLENVEYCRVLVMLDNNSSSICHAVLPGGTLPSLPDYQESWDVLGWYDAAADEPFDITQPIYEDTIVYVKRLPGEEDRISPLQMVPITAVMAFLAVAVLADRNRRRIRQAKREKSIAKQKVM